MSSMTFKVHVTRQSKGRLDLREGERPPAPVVAPVPARIARLVALAHHVEGLVRSGKVRDYADVAALGGITRARVTQIVNLLLLAPDIQAQLLDMERPPVGREEVGERDVRDIAAEMDWNVQRRMFRALMQARQDRFTNNS